MNIEEFVSLLKYNLDLKRRDDCIEYGDILNLLEEIKSLDCKDKTPKVIANEDNVNYCECGEPHTPHQIENNVCENCDLNIHP